MPNALELRARRANVWERMKEIVDKAETEDRAVSDEERQNLNLIDQEIGQLDQRIADQERLEHTPMDDGELRQRQDRARFNMEKDLPVSGRDFRSTPEYRESFLRWLTATKDDLFLDHPEDRKILRAGQATLIDAQLRALSSVSMTAGGYFIPEDFRARLEKAESFFGGMRQVSTILTTDSGEDLSLPTNNDTGNTGRILTENTTLTQTDPSIGRRTWKAFMYSSDLVLVPYQLLQDSAIDIEDWLANILGERIGRITNTHFTVGTGVDTPWGMATASVQGRQGAVGQTTTIVFDDVFLLEHAVNIAYRSGASWMMHDNTLRDIRRLKDGDGQYIWRPGVTEGVPGTLLGYRYVINNDVATMAASARSILFGMFSKYIIRDVRGVQMVRLDERYADSLQVGFFAFSRHDGGLLDAGTNPVQHYANSAT